MRRMCILGVLLALALLPGCAPGYNSILFATRSNLGFDADTSPPNLEIGISRYEGVLEPTFEGGQTVPVMGSFSSDSDAFYRFFWGVRSTFSTGQAAYIMSDLYNEKTPDKPWDDSNIPVVRLSKEPELNERIRFLKEGEVRPVIFGTDTNLGVKIRWSGQTAQYPSSINIGFKRKEAAWAPLGLKQFSVGTNPDNTPILAYKVNAPSLLATIDVGVTAEQGAHLTYLQYFATGAAADNLARRREVREAMLKRSDPVQAAIAEKVKLEAEQKETNREIINKIINSFNSFKAAPDKQEKIVAKAQGLNLVAPAVTKDTFVQNLKILGVRDASVTNDLKELEKFASDPK